MTYLSALKSQYSTAYGIAGYEQGIAVPNITPSAAELVIPFFRQRLVEALDKSLEFVPTWLGGFNIESGHNDLERFDVAIAELHSALLGGQTDQPLAPEDAIDFWRAVTKAAISAAAYGWFVPDNPLTRTLESAGEVVHDYFIDAAAGVLSVLGKIASIAFPVVAAGALTIYIVTR